MSNHLPPSLQPKSIWIGWDPREAAAFAVSVHSARRRLTIPIPVRGLVLRELREAGLYTRRTGRLHRPGCPTQLYDIISDAPMSTEFAISRFLVPHLAKSGWALFLDGDVLVRHKLTELFDMADPTKAVQVVKHDFDPTYDRKMDEQLQQRYPRKAWSSVMLFNVEHPANRNLTVELINNAPGRDLHAFCWLKDSEIGELPVAWNWLVGHSNPDVEPKIVHFTDGAPCMLGYERQPYAGEWEDVLAHWAGAGVHP